MKAISIRQPWAWLVVHGCKDVENRKWRTNYRGAVLVHAPKKVDLGAYAALKGRGVDLPPLHKLEVGGIIGRVEIVDCVNESSSPWFSGPFGFVLSSPKPLPFQPCRGALSFFRPDLP